MKIHEAAQGTQAWLEARAGIPTASEFDALITPLWKIRTGEGVTSYIARKLAEKWGGPLPSFGGSGQISWAMEQGQILETEVIPWYEYETGEQIQRVGFITTDDEKAGCSPDERSPSVGRRTPPASIQHPGCARCAGEEPGVISRPGWYGGTPTAASVGS